jgi:hypothetical protein
MAVLLLSGGGGVAIVSGGAANIHQHSYHQSVAELQEGDGMLSVVRRRGVSRFYKCIFFLIQMLCGFAIFV